MNVRPLRLASAFGVLLAVWGGSHPARGDAPPPDWLREAAAAEFPPYGPEVPAVVLLRHHTLVVAPDGRTTSTERGAIRILTNTGGEYAWCRAVYLAGDQKVTGMRAWLVMPEGEVHAFGRKESVDTRLTSNDVYDEYRQRSISAEAGAAPGATFGYEWTREGRSVFMQFLWGIPDALPTRVSRLTLRLPPGWHSTGTTFNHAPVAPIVGDDGMSWELHDLAPAPGEPAAPPASALMPRLALSFGPGNPEHPAFVASFRSWDEVSRWLASLSDPQARLDDDLRARATALVAGRAPGLDRIRAIGTFVQNLNYIAIDTDIGRGGGYKPHAARTVLEKGYGDCKDKANLMRALLAAIDVPSWLVSIRSDDPSYVREEWPSPLQFNHCILAIRAPLDASLAASLEDETRGRLCLFDPTDPFTPLGDLPETEQGGLALIVAEDGGRLIRAPLIPPGSNLVRRTVEVRMQASGEIEAAFHQTSTGAAARSARARLHGSTESGYKRRVERRIGRVLPGATVLEITHTDDRIGNRFDLDVAFKAPRWGRRLSPTLYALSPALVRCHESFEFTEPDRTLPIVLPAEREEEAVNIALPSSFTVEEFPDTVSLETAIGSYRNAYSFQDGTLRASRALAIHGATLPADRYPEVVAFFKAVRSAETATILLHVSP